MPKICWFKLLSVIFFTICISLLPNPSQASAWVRPKNTVFTILEFLRESNQSDLLFQNKNISGYKTNAYKLYLEYGLSNKITIGGYLKDYNYTYKYYEQNTVTSRKKIEHDYYTNLFLIQNLYNKNRNLFSFEYSFYAPIKYSGFSKEFNMFDTQNSFEFLVLFGKDDEIKNIVKYFIDSRLGYRVFNNINYDRLTFETTLGLRLNPTSAVKLYYEYQDHIKTDIFTSKDHTYDYNTSYNSNQIKLSLNYKFLDELSTEFSYYKKFSRTNSTGIIFSFIFEFK